MMKRVTFECDEGKDKLNQDRHGVSFQETRRAFEDQNRIIVEDLAHSQREKRCFCLGKVGQDILPVRFTYREGRIRIFGAGYWRKGRRRYEQEQRNH